MIKIDTFETALERASSHIGIERRLIGIVDKPGSGKSRLSRAVVNALGESADSMDGFTSAMQFYRTSVLLIVKEHRTRSTYTAM